MAIRGVLNDGCWIDDPNSVKEEFRGHFQTLFSKQASTRPRTQDAHFSHLSTVQIQSLNAVFTRDEIKKAVWDSGSSKAPGLDGFTFGFLKWYLDIVHDDIFDMVSHFHTHSSIPKGCNASVFTMIPKIKDPKVVKYYRPISLIGCEY